MACERGASRGGERGGRVDDDSERREGRRRVRVAAGEKISFMHFKRCGRGKGEGERLGSSIEDED